MSQNVEEDRLITIEELAGMVGVTHRAILQARSEGRLAIPVITISARNIRVRLSDARAIVRGEAVIFRPLTEESARRLRERTAKAVK